MPLISQASVSHPPDFVGSGQEGGGSDLNSNLASLFHSTKGGNTAAGGIHMTFTTLLDTLAEFPF